MKRILFIVIVILSLFTAETARGQGAAVVVDPTQIGVHIENAASNLETALGTLNEVGIINERFDEVFKGVEEGLSLLRDLGTLQQMTDEYVRLIERCTEYATQIQEWSKEDGFEGYTEMAEYIGQVYRNGTYLLQAFKTFFNNVRSAFDVKLKRSEQTILDLKALSNDLDEKFESLAKARELTLVVSQTYNSLDNLTGPQSSRAYAKYYNYLGSKEDAANMWVVLIRIFQGLSLIVMFASGFIMVFRGNEAGIMSSSVVLVRIIVAAVVSFIALTVLGFLL